MQNEFKTMGFQPYQDVVILQDLPEEGLQAGDLGTVVERHDVVGLEPGYSLEFFDGLGNTVAIVTVPASLLRTPKQTDRPAVRQLVSIS